ncbi:UMP kinase [Candidatus Parcubacteria bacterium]|nr:MAG: UMP kinase [Candidatus Parcubacteria bacterium]
MKNKELFIISLGGSLIAPQEGIDWKFLKKFRELILKEIKKDKIFVIVTGGGNTARVYQQAANKVCKLTKDDQDWLGIHTTRLNAHLIKTIFRDVAHPRINKNPRTKEDLKIHFKKGEGVMVAAGWRPGWSTDYVATILAERLEAKTVINLSNIEYAYTKDPNKYKNAEKLIEVNWKDFRKIVGNKWDPGLNAPFDPIASKLAQKLKLKVIIAKGGNIKNLEKILANKKYKGTTIN